MRESNVLKSHARNADSYSQVIASYRTFVCTSRHGRCTVKNSVRWIRFTNQNASDNTLTVSCLSQCHSDSSSLSLPLIYSCLCFSRPRRPRRSDLMEEATGAGPAGLEWSRAKGLALSSSISLLTTPGAVTVISELLYLIDFDFEYEFDISP